MRNRKSKLLTLLWTGCLPLLLVAGIALPVSAAVVEDRRAEFAWEPAPGDVVEYGVWVARLGEPLPAVPTKRVTDTRTKISVPFGSSVTVTVAAFYATGQQGPSSPPSELVHFRRPAPAPYDLDGNGAADIVMLEVGTTARTALLMEGGSLFDRVSLPATAGEDWQIAGSSDFDGDGYADLVVSEIASGSAEVWFMQAGEVRERKPIASMGAGWYARALGDAEPDGSARLIWHDQNSGNVELWQLTGARLKVQLPLLPMAPSWQIWANCDVDGNGFRDIVWMDDSSQRARVWLMDAGDAIEDLELPHPGPGWGLAGCGAMDATRRDIVLWERDRYVLFWGFVESDGTRLHGERLRRRKVGGQRDVVAQVGDLDADGDADVVLINHDKNMLRLRAFDGTLIVDRSRIRLNPSRTWEIVSW